MRIQSVKLNRQTMHLPRKFLPLVWFILQRPPFFTRKNGRIGTASDSLFTWTSVSALNSGWPRNILKRWLWRHFKITSLNWLCYLIWLKVLSIKDIKRWPNQREETWPRGYKTFFFLNSTEHEISDAHKN